MAKPFLSWIEAHTFACRILEELDLAPFEKAKVRLEAAG